MNSYVIKFGRRQVLGTLQECSAAYRQYIEENNLGSSEAPRCHLLTQVGRVPKFTKIGRLSYNGRAWQTINGSVEVELLA